MGMEDPLLSYLWEFTIVGGTGPTLISTSKPSCLSTLPESYNTLLKTCSRLIHEWLGSNSPYMRSIHMFWSPILTLNPSTEANIYIIKMHMQVPTCLVICLPFESRMMRHGMCGPRADYDVVILVRTYPKLRTHLPIEE